MRRSTRADRHRFRKQLAKRARQVLRKNWVRLGRQRGFTMPSAQQYPYQWNWDSGFIAYGYAHREPERALTELRTLLDGQWENGMLPHIVFHMAKMGKRQPYFPGPAFWQSQAVNRNAPRTLRTSGFTQPPMVTLAVWHVFSELRKTNSKHAKTILEEFYPKLFRFHRYLMTARDPEGLGLVTIYHPWESGFDNSPRWDIPLGRIRPKKIPPYRRRDLFHVDPHYRPSTQAFDRFVYLAWRAKQKGYNDRRIYPIHPFKVKDKVFSSILYLANRRLHQMASVLGDPTTDIKDWMRRFEKNLFRKLWNPKERTFSDYDLVAKRQLPSSTIAGLLPLMSGLLSERQVATMVKNLRQANFCGEEACAIPLAPSVGINEAEFNHELYWRGPIWININWFLWRALRLYGLDTQAHHQAHHLLQLIAQKGFFEYYSPKTGEGLGATDFSWTAALAIDLLHLHRRTAEHL